jgi:hypothetical protein
MQRLSRHQDQGQRRRCRKGRARQGLAKIRAFGNEFAQMPKKVGAPLKDLKLERDAHLGVLAQPHRTHVDDIHIPTIRQIYDVLRDDRMWMHLEDVLTTAFFQRTEAPLLDPFCDGWPLQQFNLRHFQDKALLDACVPGWREGMPPQPATPTVFESWTAGRLVTAAELLSI